MNKIVFVFLMALLFVNGCSGWQKLDAQELRNRYQEQQPKKPITGNYSWQNDLWYTGSDSQYHYFCHYSIAMYFEQKYKIPRNQVRIQPEFPRTNRRELWSKIENPSAPEFNLK